MNLAISSQVRPFAWSLLLLSGMSACSMPGLGQSFYQPSVPVEPQPVEIVVVAVVPSTGEILVTPNAPQSVSESTFDAAAESLAAFPEEWRDFSMPKPIEPFRMRTEVVFDLGVGEAPYDDSDTDFQLEPEPLRGFSDALVQFELRNHIEPHVSWHGVAALHRVQDDSLMNAVSEGDWGWFGVGLQFSW